MEKIRDYVLHSAVDNYVEAGFSEEQAEAMAWIASQKPRGKALGFIGGSFLALSWGHWHERLMRMFKVKLRIPQIYTQLFLVAVGITFGDYVYCVPRHGANEFIANNLMLNNNLFTKNLSNLNENFQILNRKFTAEEILYFNQRATAFRNSRTDLKNRKWIHNQLIETKEEFERRVKLNLTPPWEDAQIRKTIIEENPSKATITFGPAQLAKLIDQTGHKLGIIMTPSYKVKYLE